LVIRWLAEYRSDLPVSRLPSCCKGRVFSEEIRILTLSLIAGATVSELLRIGIRRQQIRHLRLAMCPFPLRLVFDLVAGSVARLLGRQHRVQFLHRGNCRYTSSPSIFTGKTLTEYSSPLRHAPDSRENVFL